MIRLFTAVHLILLAGFAASAAYAQAPASDVTLRVAGYGGVSTDVMKKFVGDLYTERTGVKVEFIDASPKTHLAKMIAAKGREPPYDVVFMDEDVQAEAIDAGVLAKLDKSKVPNLARIFPDARNKEGYGPAINLASHGIAYNPEKFKAAGIPAPTSWADLWDPRLAGHVGVPSIDNIMGRIFIVAAAKLVGPDAPLEKGVEKIAQIKAHSYYISSTDLEAKWQSGGVWAAPWISSRAWGLATRGSSIRFVNPKEGGYSNYGVLNVVAGSKHVAEAEAFINFALDPLPQLAQIYERSSGATNEAVANVITTYPAIAETVPSPDDLAHMNHVDWRKFAPQYPKLLNQWNRTIMSK